MIKVYLPTAGQGTRMGGCAKYANKAILPVNSKALFTHIVEKFPSDTEYIIALGYLKDQVVNYIEIAQSLNISPDKLKLLINIAEKDQKIIRINEELLFTSQNFNNLVQEIKTYFIKNNKLTISDFKDIAKTSRKYAVPLLEYFDKQNITYRENNYRKLV